jgi:hypothetical protein
MMSRSVARFSLVLCAFAASFLAARPASAQSTSAEKPPLYTYVSEWAVPRSMWADYQKMTAGEMDGMNKLVADGTIVSFGSFTILNHQEGQPTHGSWFQAGSLAKLLKVLEDVRLAPTATAPVLAASKHWDYILESHNYNAQSGAFKNGYLRVGHWKYKAGATDPDGKIMKATAVALLEKLQAAGAIYSYEFDEETIHSEDPNSFYMAIITSGAEGLDKLSMALEESEKKDPAGMAGFGALLDDQGHRDFLSRVDVMNHK